MNKPNAPTLAERLRDTAAIDAAIQRAAREAVIAHVQAGLPLATWRDGRVVWVQADEVLATLSDRRES